MMGLGAFLLLFTPLLQGFFGSSQSVLAGEKKKFHLHLQRSMGVGTGELSRQDGGSLRLQPKGL